MREERSTALATVVPTVTLDQYEADPGLGWPYIAVRPADDHPLARRVIGMFGLILGASAGLFVGGLGAALLAALLHPFMPQLAHMVLICVTVFSLAVGGVVGRRVLERETFEI